MYAVYFLRSLKTSRYYVGHTDKLFPRFLQHNSGYSRSTRHGIPWALIYWEEYRTRSEAMRVEKQVKARGIERYLRDKGVL